MSEDEHHEELVEVLDEEFINNYGADVDTTCTICQAEFLDPEDLTVHLHQIHYIKSTGSKLCVFCSQSYTDMVDFAEHFRDNHLCSLFYCFHCLRAFTDEYELRLHEKKHRCSLQSAYCCSQCTRQFGNISDLRKHDMADHDNNDEGVMMYTYLPYLSGVLNVKAETVLLSVRTDTVYICVCCGYSTSDIKQFIDHSKTNTCKTYVCDICSNVYKKRHSMHLHASKYCWRNYNYKMMSCPDCKLVFNKLTFKEHKKICRVIKCYTCDIRYDTMYELSEHQSMEHPLSVELMACTFCWKQCVGSVALQKHVSRSHKGNLHLYKYLCVYCKTPFMHPQKLFGHFFTKHKDLEPYTCKICTKKFKLRKRFTLHIKLEHKSVGFVEFDENYHVFFTDKKSEKPFIPQSFYGDQTKKNAACGKKEGFDNSPLNMKSEISVTETVGNVTDVDAEAKPMLKRKRGQKARKQKKKKKEEETITVESSDDECLAVVRQRVLKQQKPIPELPKVGGKSKYKQSVNNKKRFTCPICKKYCYTYQNFNHHITLHSQKHYKKCMKCSEEFSSKNKLNEHIASQHTTSKLTETLKYMLEKRKKGESIADDLPMAEKFRRTIKKVEPDKILSSAKIEEVDNSLSVQKFIESFTPEESKIDVIINHTVTIKAVQGKEREAAIQMTKFESKPVSTALKLSMPVKFKPSQCERTAASIRVVEPVPVVKEDSQDIDYDDDDSYNFMDRNESIPEVAEEVMLGATEETPRVTHYPHKIVLPNLPAEYKDLRIAHLLPQAPYYKIVKVKDVLKRQNEELAAENIQVDIKLPDGTKLVNTNPLAHLLGETSIEKVMEPMRNKYYKSKVRNFQGMLAEALSNLDKPVVKKKKEQKAVGENEEN